MNHEYLIRMCPSLVCVLLFFYSLNAGVGTNVRRPCGVVNALNWTEIEEMEDRYIDLTLHRALSQY